MADSRERLIFDTSGLNALAKDPDAAVIAKCLGMQSCVRITETNLAEIAGAHKPEKRAYDDFLLVWPERCSSGI